MDGSGETAERDPLRRNGVGRKHRCGPSGCYVGNWVERLHLFRE